MNITTTQSEIGGRSVQVASARELHAFLGVGKDFTDWIKVQVERAGLVEDEDYVFVEESRVEDGAQSVPVSALGLAKEAPFDPFLPVKLPTSSIGERQVLISPKKGRLNSGVQTQTEVLLTVESAKHIAMMSNTSKGKEVRKYFIGVERAYNALQIRLAREAGAQLSFPEALDTLKPVAFKAAQHDLKSIVTNGSRRLLHQHLALGLDEGQTKAEAEELLVAQIEFYIENAAKLLKAQGRG